MTIDPPPDRPCYIVWCRSYTDGEYTWADELNETLAEAVEAVHWATDADHDALLLEVVEPDGTRTVYTPDEARALFPPPAPEPPAPPSWSVVLDPPPEVVSHRPAHEYLGSAATEEEARAGAAAWARFGDRIRIVPPREVP